MTPASPPPATAATPTTARRFIGSPARRGGRTCPVSTLRQLSAAARNAARRRPTRVQPCCHGPLIARTGGSLGVPAGAGIAARVVGHPAPAFGRGPLHPARRRGVRARAPQLWRLALDAAGRPNGPGREGGRDRPARDDSVTRRRWDAVARAGLSASAPRLLADVAHAVLPP